jgi:PTH2 family peptidyl-tRNA hydrolase|tara:strand:+ start:4319 stop:4672 length:354 start_codon:yes stop_codon:yes gene_type:complete
LEYKLVIIVRTDLGISKGKMAAQVAHAAVNCSLKSKKSDPSNFKGWYGDGQKKVVVKGTNESLLRELQQHARDVGLTYSLVSDAGLTEVPPGTVTCLGIGPSTESKIDEITGKLSLF